MNYCPKCGKPVDAGSKFCKECGQDLSGPVSSGDNRSGGQKFGDFLVRNLPVLIGCVLIFLASRSQFEGSTASVFIIAGELIIMLSACLLEKRRGTLPDYIAAFLSAGFSFFMGSFMANNSMNILGGVVVVLAGVINLFVRMSRKK